MLPSEGTEWHRVVFYNRLADIAGEYLREGHPVYVEGRLRTRKWASEGGQDRYTIRSSGHWGPQGYAVTGFCFSFV